MTTATDTIQEFADREYKWGFVTDIEAETSRGLERRHRPPHLRQEAGAGLAARMAAQGVSPLAHDGRAGLAQRPLSADRLSEHHLLLGPEAEEAAHELDEVDPELLRPSRSSASPLRRAKAAFRRRRRCGLRFRLGGDHVQGKAGEMGIIFCSFSEAVKEHPDLVRKYLGTVVPYTDNYLRHAELRRLHRWLVLLTSPRACTARWSCPPISASTPRTPASSSAR